MFKSLMLVIVAATSSNAATIFTDLSSFVAQTGLNTVATFEDVTVGTVTPVISAGATFSAANSSATVMNSLMGLPHSLWFGSAGSSPNFFGTLTDYNVSLPSDEIAFGVLMSCFGCDLSPNDSRISWTLFSGPSGTGSVVDSGSQIIDFSTVGVRFLGVISSAPFQSIGITKLAVGSRSGIGAYVIDDFRFAATAVPEPSYSLILGVALIGLFGLPKGPARRH